MNFINKISLFTFALTSLSLSSPTFAQPSAESFQADILQPNKDEITVDESVTFGLRLGTTDRVMLDTSKVKLKLGDTATCSRFDLVGSPTAGMGLKVSECDGTGSLRVRLLAGALKTRDGRVNMETQISRKVLLNESNGPRCRQGFLPPYNQPGFKDWYGYRRYAMSPGQTYVFCHEINKDTQSLTLKTVDQSGAAQCPYHYTEGIPPAGSNLKWLKSSVSTFTTLTWRIWNSPELLPRGVYKFVIHTSADYPDCPFAYEITAH